LANSINYLSFFSVEIFRFGKFSHFFSSFLFPFLFLSFSLSSSLFSSSRSSRTHSKQLTHAQQAPFVHRTHETERTEQGTKRSSLRCRPPSPLPPSQLAAPPLPPLPSSFPLFPLSGKLPMAGHGATTPAMAAVTPQNFKFWNVTKIH
jgi:hypothetical protein